MKFNQKSKEPFCFVRGKVGCLLIHGFSGSPSEMRFLGEKLAEKGYTVKGVLLAGHGKTPEEMRATNWTDWYDSVQQGYLEIKNICDKIYIIGLSMGGALSLYAASDLEVNGVVSICAPIYLTDRKALLAPVFQHFVPYYNKAVSQKDLALNEEMQRFTYYRVPLKSLAHLLKLIKALRQRLPKIKTPALIIQSKRDKVVQPKSAIYIYEQLTSEQKQLVWLEKSGHLATIEVERDKVYQLIRDFIQKEEEADEQK